MGQSTLTELAEKEISIPEIREKYNTYINNYMKSSDLNVQTINEMRKYQTYLAELFDFELMIPKAFHNQLTLEQIGEFKTSERNCYYSSRNSDFWPLYYYNQIYRVYEHIESFVREILHQRWLYKTIPLEKGTINNTK